MGKDVVVFTLQMYFIYKQIGQNSIQMGPEMSSIQVKKEGTWEKNTKMYYSFANFTKAQDHMNIFRASPQSWKVP